uniref:Uncharacterized protein n=1 Tax=Cucumis sativus TaxID=3659 RepID=A0A0A0KCF4_CUCSA
MVNMGRSILDQPSSKSNSLNMPSGSRISARRRYSSILFRASLPAVKTAIRFSFILPDALPFPDYVLIANASLFSGFL